jgi:hypothetical protein
MTVEEGNGDPAPEVTVPSVVGRRKLGRGGKVLKRLQRTKQPEEPRMLTVGPHCNRRFLTRGNIKNHLRIHSRDKPFHCPICQVSLETIAFRNYFSNIFEITCFA